MEADYYYTKSLMIATFLSFCKDIPYDFATVGSKTAIRFPDRLRCLKIIDEEFTEGTHILHIGDFAQRHDKIRQGMGIFNEEERRKHVR